MRKGIQLFEYQLDMIRRIDEAFSAHQSVMVQMPTGTGKTMLLAEQVKSEERRVKNSSLFFFTLSHVVQVRAKAQKLLAQGSPLGLGMWAAIAL